MFQYDAAIESGSTEASGAAPLPGSVSAVPSLSYPLRSAPPLPVPMFNVDRPNVDVMPTPAPSMFLPPAPAVQSLNAEPVVAAGNFLRAHWPWLLIALLVLLVVMHSRRGGRE